MPCLQRAAADLLQLCQALLNLCFVRVALRRGQVLRQHAPLLSHALLGLASTLAWLHRLHRPPASPDRSSSAPPPDGSSHAWQWLARSTLAGCVPQALLTACAPLVARGSQAAQVGAEDDGDHGDGGDEQRAAHAQVAMAALHAMAQLVPGLPGVDARMPVRGCCGPPVLALASSCTCKHHAHR